MIWTMSQGHQVSVLGKRKRVLILGSKNEIDSLLDNIKLITSELLFLKNEKREKKEITNYSVHSIEPNDKEKSSKLFRCNTRSFCIK